jgi:hypothetical protein
MTDSSDSTAVAVSGELLDSMPPDRPAGTALQVNPYLGMIETMISKGGDLANLDKMLDLQIRWEANEARKAFVAAMAAFKAEPITITKGKHVSYRNKSGGLTEYDHAELADITQKVVPAMAKHGLSHRWTFRQDASKGITVGCVITHRLGHSDEPVEMTAPPDDSGGKNTIQSIASTKTYLERYTLLAATGVATGGELDDDGRDPFDDRTEGDGLAGIAQRDADWIRTAQQLEHPAEYAEQRSKMLKDYGGVDHMPLAVRNAFNEAKARVTPKDVE